MSHPLCGATVTLYRNTENGVQRFLLEKCGLQNSRVLYRDALGKVTRTDFLLVAPGEYEIRIGDRILEGDNPLKSRQELFDAMEVKQVTPYCVGGKVYYTEARG